MVHVLHRQRVWNGVSVALLITFSIYAARWNAMFARLRLRARQSGWTTHEEPRSLRLSSARDFPTWQSSYRPCFCCAVPRRCLHDAASASVLSPPHALNQDVDSHEACETNPLPLHIDRGINKEIDFTHTHKNANGKQNTRHRSDEQCNRSTRREARQQSGGKRHPVPPPPPPPFRGVQLSGCFLFNFTSRCEGSMSPKYAEKAERECARQAKRVMSPVKLMTQDTPSMQMLWCSLACLTTSSDEHEKTSDLAERKEGQKERKRRGAHGQHPRSKGILFGLRQAYREHRTRSWRAAGRRGVPVWRGARRRHDTHCFVTITTNWQRQRRLEACGWSHSVAKIGHDHKSCATWRHDPLMGNDS